MPPKRATGVGGPAAPPLWAAFTARFGELLDAHLPHQAAVARLIACETVTHPGMPNLLLYGPRGGVPLDMLYHHALARRFGAFTSRELVYDKTLPYRETPYTFELDFAHPNLPKDLSVLPEFVKSVVSARCIHSARHVILLRNVDALLDRQPFRVLLERFSQNALFICTTHRVTALEPPLQSRFQHLRVPLPTVDEITAIFAALGAPPPHGPSIASRNLLKAIATAATAATATTAATADAPPASAAYPPLVAFLARPKPTLEGIRQMAVKTYQANVPFARAAQDVVAYLTQKGDVKNARGFLEEAADLEHVFAGAARGRAPIYYEYLLHLAVARCP